MRSCSATTTPTRPGPRCPVAVELARSLGAKLVIGFGYEPPRSGGEVGALRGEIEKLGEEFAAAAVAQVQRLDPDLPSRCSWSRTGRSRRSCGWPTPLDARFIVVGHRQRHLLAEVFIGSVLEGVMSETARPVRGGAARRRLSIGPADRRRSRSGEVAAPKPGEPGDGDHDGDQGEDDDRRGGERAARQLRRVGERREVHHPVAELEERSELAQEDEAAEGHPAADDEARGEPEERDVIATSTQVAGSCTSAAPTTRPTCAESPVCTARDRARGRRRRAP